MNKIKKVEPCVFAYASGNCKILTSRHCRGCTMYKTSEELYAGRAAAMERLLSLPNRKYYIDKYHTGASIAELEATDETEV